jgi:predicted DNA-binding transcriptional regulator YafY
LSRTAGQLGPALVPGWLAGWDTGRQDWRAFRVDRISLKTPNGLRFAARDPPAEDLAGYVARGVNSRWLLA